ncbi:MAG: response regulator [Granulosicoccus sp.]
MDERLRIIVIDDHRLFTAGLKAVLATLGRSILVDEVTDPQRALSRLAGGEYCDLILLDLDMPGLSGVDFISALNEREIVHKIIVISATTDYSLVRQALSSGARGFIPKSLSPQQMLFGIEQVLSGRTYLPPHLVDLLLDTENSTAQNQQSDVPPESGSNGCTTVQLSERQRQILQMMERGLSNKQIANVLGISTSTVKFHITALFKDLGVTTRTECTHIARKMHLA